MGYLSRSEIEKIGFKSIGVNVKISDKASIYDPERIEIGDNSRIDDFSLLSGRVAIGRFVYIAPFCLIAGGDKGVFLSEFSTLAYKVQIFSQSDDYTGETMTNSTVSASYKSEFKSPVYLGRHVIVGAGSIVFPGVEVAEGCSVGAMTLVNKSTLPWGIYAGNPARRMKERRKDLLELEKKFLGENTLGENTK